MSTKTQPRRRDIENRQRRKRRVRNVESQLKSAQKHTKASVFGVKRANGKRESGCASGRTCYVLLIRTTTMKRNVLIEKVVATHTSNKRINSQIELTYAKASGSRIQRR